MTLDQLGGVVFDKFKNVHVKQIGILSQMIRYLRENPQKVFIPASFIRNNLNLSSDDVTDEYLAQGVKTLNKRLEEKDTNLRIAKVDDGYMLVDKETGKVMQAEITEVS